MVQKVTIKKHNTRASSGVVMTKDPEAYEKTVEQAESKKVTTLPKRKKEEEKKFDFDQSEDVNTKKRKSAVEEDQEFSDSPQPGKKDKKKKDKKKKDKKKKDKKKNRKKDDDDSDFSNHTPSTKYGKVVAVKAARNSSQKTLEVIEIPSSSSLEKDEQQRDERESTIKFKVFTGKDSAVSKIQNNFYKLMDKNLTRLIAVVDMFIQHCKYLRKNVQDENTNPLDIAKSDVAVLCHIYNYYVTSDSSTTNVLSAFNNTFPKQLTLFVSKLDVENNIKFTSVFQNFYSILLFLDFLKDNDKVVGHKQQKVDVNDEVLFGLEIHSGMFNSISKNIIKDYYDKRDVYGMYWVGKGKILRFNDDENCVVEVISFKSNLDKILMFQLGEKEMVVHKSKLNKLNYEFQKSIEEDDRRIFEPIKPPSLDEKKEEILVDTERQQFQSQVIHLAQPVYFTPTPQPSQTFTPTQPSSTQQSLNSFISDSATLTPRNENVPSQTFTPTQPSLNSFISDDNYKNSLLSFLRNDDSGYLDKNIDDKSPLEIAVYYKKKYENLHKKYLVAIESIKHFNKLYNSIKTWQKKNTKVVKSLSLLGVDIEELDRDVIIRTFKSGNTYVLKQSIINELLELKFYKRQVRLACFLFNKELTEKGLFYDLSHKERIELYSILFDIEKRESITKGHLFLDDEDKFVKSKIKNLKQYVHDLERRSKIKRNSSSSEKSSDSESEEEEEAEEEEEGEE
ncbi:hypothetical protein ABK040_003634 [Willaertia magna]